MSWSSRIALLGLAAVSSYGCRIEVGGAAGVDAVAASDTLRLRCSAGSVLASESALPLSLPVERLLVAGEDLLAVTRGGDLVHLPEGTGPPRPLLSGGKDYDVLDGVVARLVRDRVDFFRHEGERLVALSGGVPIEPHEVSVALGPRTVHLHSPADPANVLVTVLDRRSGERKEAYLPVDRSFLRLLLKDPDALLVETGRLRAGGDRLAFVPAIHDPVVLLGARPRALFLADGERGVMRTFEREETVTERPCPTCTEHRDVTSRQEVRPLYADAAFAGEALWILRLIPAGSSRATLLRVGLEDPEGPEVHSWRLGDLDAAPTAIALWGGMIVVADGRHLHRFGMPRLTGGARCRTG